MAELRRRLPSFVAIAVLVLAWVVARAMFEIEVRFSDVPLFRRYGEAFADGSILYRDTLVEYPPGAVPLFWLPALVSSTLGGYAIALEVLLVLCASASLVAMDVVLDHVGRPLLHRWGALLLVASTPLLLGRVVAERYDLWPAALTVMAVAAAVARKHRLAGALLGAGAAAKLFPAALLPLFTVWAWQRAGRRRAVQTVACFTGVALAVFLPFLIASASDVVSVLEHQIERPLQLETLGSALLQVAHHTAGLSLGLESSYGSINLGGAKAAAVVSMQTLLLAITLIAVVIAFARRRGGPEELVTCSAATITAVVVLGKVLSPQFIVWILPLVPLVRGRSGLAASGLLAAACLTTHALFPSRYVSLIRLEREAAALLLVRNLLLASVLVVLLVALAAQLRARERRRTADAMA